LDLTMFYLIISTLGLKTQPWPYPKPFSSTLFPFIISAAPLHPINFGSKLISTKSAQTPNNFVFNLLTYSNSFEPEGSRLLIVELCTLLTISKQVYLGSREIPILMCHVDLASRDPKWMSQVPETECFDGNHCTRDVNEGS